MLLVGYMLGRAAEDSQPSVIANGIHQDPVASTSLQPHPSGLSLLFSPSLWLQSMCCAYLLMLLVGYMLGRASEESQPAVTANGIQQDPVASTSQQTGPPELSQKASEAFDAAAAGGLKSMADLKAVTSDIMDRSGQPESSGRSASPQIGSIEHLSPAANLAMLQACARYGPHDNASTVGTTLLSTHLSSCNSHSHVYKTFENG